MFLSTNAFYNQTIENPKAGERGRVTLKYKEPGKICYEYKCINIKTLLEWIKP